MERELPAGDVDPDFGIAVLGLSTGGVPVGDPGAIAIRGWGVVGAGGDRGWLVGMAVGTRAKLVRTLWVKLWCLPGALYMLAGLNQLFYVAALTLSVPTAVVFLANTYPVVTTLVLGWIYPRLGRPDRHAPTVSRSVWLMCSAWLARD